MTSSRPVFISYVLFILFPLLTFQNCTIYYKVTPDNYESIEWKYPKVKIKTTEGKTHRFIGYESNDSLYYGIVVYEPDTIKVKFPKNTVVEIQSLKKIKAALHDDRRSRTRLKGSVIIDGHKYLIKDTVIPFRKVLIDPPYDFFYELYIVDKKSTLIVNTAIGLGIIAIVLLII